MKILDAEALQAVAAVEGERRVLGVQPAEALEGEIL